MSHELDMFRQQWDRVLPEDEILSDRFSRAQYLGFGRKTSVYHNSYIYGDVQVGDNCWIGPMTLLDGTGGLKIGDFVCISTGVQIYTHETIDRFLLGDETLKKTGQVTIQSNCYIGPNVVIAMGVTVGHHSIVGAGAVVLTSFPPYSTIAGAPARLVGHTIKRLPLLEKTLEPKKMGT